MTEFLRERYGKTERAFQSDQYTAKDRSHALSVLRGVVLILRHPYEADPFSGAGNCWCGRDRSSALHDVVVLGAEGVI